MSDKMKVKCSHPNCQNTKDFPGYNAVILNLSKFYLCKDHRDDWENLQTLNSKLSNFESSSDNDFIRYEIFM